MLLVAATLVPLLALTALVVVLADRAERAARERTVQDVSRALASTVDRELGVSVAALRTLATSTALAEGDYRSFYSAAQRAHRENPQWLTVYLIEESIALTAHGMMRDRAQSLAAGYNVHIAKPVDPDELTAVIATFR
jgi:hypothetical protein